MNQSRAFVTSLIFAGIAMVLVFLYVSEQENKLKSQYGNEVVVAVALKDIQEFEVITSEHITTKVIPGKFEQPGAIRIGQVEEGGRVKEVSVQELIGTVAAVPFRAGEQITRTKVLQKGAETGLATQVAIAHRALSIPVSDRTGVSRLIKPGDRIDIVSNVSYRADGGQESEVKTLLQNINILAVGEQVQNQIPSFLEVDPLTGTSSARNLRRDNRSFATVTVEVTPLEAQSLIYVMNVGADLYLTLRNPVDRVVASTLPTTTVDEVLGPNSKRAQRNRPAPIVFTPKALPPPPPPPNPWLQGGSSLVK